MDSPKVPQEEDSNKLPEDYKRTAIDFFYDGIVWIYKKFMHFVSLNDDDPIPLVFFKITLRAIGVLIALAISPFVIIGFIIAIMVVS